MLLVTGGGGFIGSHFLELLKQDCWDHNQVVNVDKLTYAANRDFIRSCGYLTHVVDIADYDRLRAVFLEHDITAVINFAAETHVDNSINSADAFVQTNVIGTVNLLNLSKEFGVEYFLQVSTDEVFGSIEHGAFTELSPLNPRNPYSASKASAEAFCLSYANTYGMNICITNCGNNWGIRQHKEKFIPTVITKLLAGKQAPLYGNGQQRRDWIHVQDHVKAIYMLWIQKKTGRWCISGEEELSNRELAEELCSRICYNRDQIAYVPDRPGHDVRYATSAEKIRTQLGWKPRLRIRSDLSEVIDYYKSLTQA